MKAKAKRAFKHLKKIGVAKWAVDALKDYFNLSEQLILEAEKGELAQIVLNQKRERIMAMMGIYVYPGITLNTVNFLYNNIDELRVKNGHISLTRVLFRLQMLFEDLGDYGEICGYDLKPMITVEDVKEQKKKLGEEYKKQLTKK